MLFWSAFAVCLAITQPLRLSALPTNSFKERVNDPTDVVHQPSGNELNYTLNQESFHPSADEAGQLRSKVVIRSRRDAWGDCFPPPSNDPSTTILYVADIVTGILGNFGATIPPATSMIRLIKSLFEKKSQCDGKSLWQYIDSQIHRSIRDAFNRKFRLTSEAIARDRENRMNFFGERLEWLESGQRSSVEIKDLIDDMHDDWNTNDMTDRYNFVHYADMYNMDYSLATWYYADLVYKKTFLQMIMGVCEKLNEADADPKYRTATYANKLEDLMRKAIRVAIKDGPTTMKTLFWKDYSCEQTKLVYRKTSYAPGSHYEDICRIHGICHQCTLYDWHYLKCKDFFDNEWKQYWEPGYNHNGHCDPTQSLYFNGAVESADAEVIQKPVTDWMTTNFALPILKLFGCANLPDLSKNDIKTDLPHAYFPSVCRSPCNDFGKSYKWCIKGTNGQPGGSWEKCEIPSPGALDPSPSISESEWTRQIDSILQCARNNRAS